MERHNQFAAAFTKMIVTIYGGLPEGFPVLGQPPSDWTEAELKSVTEWAPKIAAIQADLASHVSAAALAAYKSGEMDLLSVLNITVTSTNLCGSELRNRLLGETVLAALAVGKPKQLNRRKSPHPTWLKNLAVDIVIFLKECDPKMKLTSTAKLSARVGGSRSQRTALEWTAVFLADLQLGTGGKGGPLYAGRPRVRISTRTLQTWYHERMSQLGIESPRGRPNNI